MTITLAKEDMAVLAVSFVHFVVTDTVTEVDLKTQNFVRRTGVKGLKVTTVHGECSIKVHNTASLAPFLEVYDGRNSFVRIFMRVTKSCAYPV